MARAVPNCLLQGELTSPRHPERYDHNLVCEWVIRLPPEDHVSIRSPRPSGPLALYVLKFRFDQFELEASTGGDCTFDYLEIREGSDTEGPLVGRYYLECYSLKVPPSFQGSAERTPRHPTSLTPTSCTSPSAQTTPSPTLASGAQLPQCQDPHPVQDGV